MVVAISLLLLLTLGATYAFFQISVKNNTTAANINLHTGELNNVALQQGVESLHIKLSAEDMSTSNTGDYYAVTEENLNYKKGTPNIVEIASIKTEGTIKDTCSGDIVISVSEGMANVLESGDAILYIKGGDIEDTLDLYNIKTDKTKKYTAYFDIDTETDTPQNIQAWLKIVNKSDEPQNYLAGLTLNLTININNFKCGVEKPIPNLVSVCTSYNNIGECVQNGNLDEIPILETDAVRKSTRPNDTLRRFQSTSQDTIKNNYICFGTNDKSKCTTSKDKYMYRIIGVVAENDTTTEEKVGMLKIIKKEALETAYAWNSSYNVEWNSAELKTNLNGGYFLSNTTYVPNEKVGSKNWSDIIANIKWRYGDIDDSSSGASQAGPKVLEKEKTWNSTIQAKIGLMYLSDYYLAYDNTRNWYSQYDKTNWLFIDNNDTSPSSHYEWTMSGHDSYNAWRVDSDGSVHGNGLGSTFSVRPVFYLISSVQLRGTGRVSDPYTISAA